MHDPILELGNPDDIELSGSSADDIQISESQEEDLLIELSEHDDITLTSGEEGDLVLEDSYAGSLPYDFYNGPYNVRPILYNGQRLETKQKILTDDVTVEAIPVTTTTNPYGGQTVVIG